MLTCYLEYFHIAREICLFRKKTLPPPSSVRIFNSEEGRNILALTGTFSFCCNAAFFFHSRSLSSLTRLSITATSELRLFKQSLCCCNLAFCSWFSLFLNLAQSKEENQGQITCKADDRMEIGNLKKWELLKEGETCEGLSWGLFL